jgi:hypothetical protein
MPAKTAETMIKAVDDCGSAVENTGGRRAYTGKKPRRDHRKTFSGPRVVRHPAGRFSVDAQNDCALEK